MNESIFSTYSTGENRVTASILAVLRCLALPRIERVLGALMEDTTFQLVEFTNQPSGGKGSVPDGRIGSSLHLLLETKLVRNDLKRKSYRTKPLASCRTKITQAASCTQPR